MSDAAHAHYEALLHELAKHKAPARMDQVAALRQYDAALNLGLGAAIDALAAADNAAEHMASYASDHKAS